MNIKPPELTIFQGMPSLHIDNSKMRPEEEEAIRDQARRNKEVNLKSYWIAKFLIKCLILAST